MLTPQRKAQMDAVLGAQSRPTLTPERRAQMDAVLNPPKKKSLGGFVENIGKSGVKMVGDLASAVTHPVDTAKGIYQLGSGIISKAIPGRQKSEDVADAVGEFYKQRYGGVDKTLNTLYNDPVGVLGDVSTVLGGVGAGAKLLGKAGKASKLAEVASATDPLAIAGRAVGKVTRPVTSNVSKIFKGLPQADDLLTRGIGNPAKQHKMIVPAEEIIPKYNLFDRSPEAVTEVIKDVNKSRRGAIEATGASASLQELLKPLDDAISELQSNKFAMKSDSAKGQLKEMIRRRQDLVETFATPETMGGAQTTNLNPKVKLSEYDAFRREAIDPDIPEGAFAQSLSKSPNKVSGAKNVRKAMKSKVDELAGTADMGKDLQSLYKLRDVFEGYQSRAKNRQLTNFTKMGGAGIGGIIKGAPGAVGGFLIEQIVNSPKGLEIMYKAAKSLEKGAFGKKLSPNMIIKNIDKQLSSYNLPDSMSVARAMYNYSRTGRMTNK